MSVPVSSNAPGQSPLPGACILCVRIPGEEPISYDVGIKVMSALGQKQTFAVQKGMSALPPKADIGRRHSNVCFVPKADIAIAAIDVCFWG
jgi:hypothetical protein